MLRALLAVLFARTAAGDTAACNAASAGCDDAVLLQITDVKRRATSGLQAQKAESIGGATTADAKLASIKKEEDLVSFNRAKKPEGTDVKAIVRGVKRMCNSEAEENRYLAANGFEDFQDWKKQTKRGGLGTFRRDVKSACCTSACKVLEQTGNDNEIPSCVADCEKKKKGKKEGKK